MSAISKKAIIIKILALVVSLGLSACHKNQDSPQREDPKLPCKVRGACDATVIKLIKKFNKRGIKVVTIGQDYLVSIPASALFADESPQLKWSSYGTLNQVAVFLKQFRKVAITVTGFSSQYMSVQRERALTQARSRVVSEYLWSQGIDSRLIFSQGLGRDKPITAFDQGGDSSPNARIEITFRDAIV